MLKIKIFSKLYGECKKNFVLLLHITTTHQQVASNDQNMVILNSGLAVGSGWQSTVAYINIGCYYIIGIPMGVLLGWLFNLGVPVPTELCAHRFVLGPC